MRSFLVMICLSILVSGNAFPASKKPLEKDIRYVTDVKKESKEVRRALNVCLDKMEFQDTQDKSGFKTFIQENGSCRVIFDNGQVVVFRSTPQSVKDLTPVCSH